MAEPSHFMGQDGFIWFVGVVEDRNDPEALGRVRVRCLGYHTENLESLPTVNLPWAHVMHPVTDPAMHGMGNTPSFLVEGSWVVGFFRDALEKQQPVIIGSLPGVPSQEPDPTVGFNDPRGDTAKQLFLQGEPIFGPYPVDGDVYKMKSGHQVGESDTSRLGQGELSETHNSLINRREMIQLDVPKAQMPWIPSVEDNPGVDDVDEDDVLFKVREIRSHWNEPNPKGIESSTNPYNSSQYPFNHVFESESGHIREVDDSPGGERLFTQHSAGGFEEIHPNGTKVVKVIADNYEIIAGDSNVYINGNVNLTIKGTKREFIKGDYILEVEGDMSTKIHKNQRTKIGAGESGGNREEEIVGNYAYNISDNVKGHIGKDIDVIIEQNESRTINGYFDGTIMGDYSLVTYGDKGLTVAANKNISLTTVSGIVSFKSGDKLNMKSATAMTIHTETTMTETIGTNAVRTVAGTLTDTVTGIGTLLFTGSGSEVTAANALGARIGLTTHTHTDPAHGSHTAETSAGNAGS